MPRSFPAAVTTDRVVAVVVTLQDGREQVGSGYLVRPGIVLTAEHCTRDKATGHGPRGICVLRASDGMRADVITVTGCRSLDIAVLDLADSSWPVNSATVFGSVDRTRPGELRGCVGIGFPLFQYDPGSRQRGTAELHGVIRPTDEAESGRLLLRDPLLETVKHPSGDDVFGGLSGALVTYRDLALGVVVEHHPRQGNAAVQLTAFDKLVRLAATNSSARNVARQLGLDPGVELPSASPELEDELPPSAVLPFSALDRFSPAFHPDKGHVRPTYDEYVGGLIDVGSRSAGIEKHLTGGSVLVVGDGAAGKTTLGLWIGLRHAKRGGITRYFDVGLHEQTTLSQALDALERVASHDALIILDNVHVNEELAILLHTQWRAMGSPGAFLALARTIRFREYYDPQGGLSSAVDHVEQMVVDSQDMLNTFSRIVAGKPELGATNPSLPPEAPETWLSLFRSDRIAFGFAIRRHLEREGLQRWIRRGARLSASDAEEYVRERYLDKWGPETRSELLKLAALAPLEFAAPEDAVTPVLLERPILEGVVQRTTPGRLYRRFSFFHSGLGTLILSAGRVSDLEPMFLSVARLSPTAGFFLAARLETVGQVVAAGNVLRAVADVPGGLVNALDSGAIEGNLRRLNDLAGVPFEEIDRRLAEAQAWRELVNRMLQYGLTGMMLVFRECASKLPLFVDRLSAHLLNESVWPDFVADAADVCAKNLGFARSFFADIPRLLPEVGPRLAKRVAEVLNMSAETAEVAHACADHLGHARNFLMDIDRLLLGTGVQLAERVVELLNTPSGAAGIASGCVKNLGNARIFLADISQRFPIAGAQLAERVVHILNTPTETAEVARACADQLGHARHFLADIPQLFSIAGAQLAERVVEILNTPAGAARIARACGNNFGEAKIFLADIPHLFPETGAQGAERVVETLNTPAEAARLTLACAKDLGAATSFLRGVGLLFDEPGRRLVQQVVAQLATPECSARVADACASNLLEAGLFLVMLSRGHSLATRRVIEALSEPVRVTQAIATSMADPISSGYFWYQASRRWPGLAQTMLQRQSEQPDAVDRIAAKIASAPERGVYALHGYYHADRALFTRVTTLIAPENLARLITADLALSGWLLQALGDLPELEAETFALALRESNVQVHLRAAEPRPDTIRCLRALANIAGRLVSAGVPEGVGVIRTLLRAFRDGHHLGSRANLEGLAIVVGLAHADPSGLQQDVNAALGSAGRSRQWLRREFLRRSSSVLAASLDELWWGCGDRRAVLALSGDDLALRLSDDLALLPSVRSASPLIGGAVGLLGLLTRFGVPMPRTVPVEAIRGAGQVIAGELSDGTSAPRSRALLCGLMELGETPLVGRVSESGRRKLVTDVHNQDVFRGRPDQDEFKQRLLVWLGQVVGE